MADLGVSQKPIVMPHYPHMLTEDTVVWSKYLADPVLLIREVWYDVHVGKAVGGLAVGDILGARIARGVTRKRIDAVCRVCDVLWVVEIKPFAGMMALGQVLSYTLLFIEEFTPRVVVLPVIVCDVVDEDLLDLFQSSGVIVLVNS